MRYPKELTDEELRQIAALVRQRVINKFGGSKFQKFQRSGGTSGIVEEVIKQTYIAVRETLEKELAERG